MAVNINTNIGALGAAAAATSVNKSMESAMSRLASGLRINSAADDAAGVAISSRMEAQVRGLNQAVRNASDGQALADTAEGAIVEINNMLQRMRQLAVQSANDTNSDEDRTNLNEEIGHLQSEIDRIVSTTMFNGKNLLDGTAAVSLHIGSEAGQTLDFAISSLGTAALGSLTGSATTNSVLSSSHQGVAATTTSAKLAFNGNDTYGFDLTVDIGAGDATLSISAAVQNNSAAAIAAAINTAAKDEGVGEYVTASVSGNVVTVQNAYGEKIDLSAFTSTNNTTATYTTVSGGNGSDSVVVLGAAKSNTGTAFNVAAGQAYNAGSDATSGTAAIFNVTISATDLANLGAANNIEVDFGNYKITVANADAGSLGDLAAAINSKTTDWTFSANGDVLTALALYPGAHTSITLNEVDADGVLDAAGTAFGAATSGTKAMTVSTAGVDPADAVAASGGTYMFLDLMGVDDYSFVLDGKDIQFSYNGTAANRGAIASQIATTLGAGYDVSHTNGLIQIRNDAGTAMALTAFESEGTGRIVASTEVATAGAEGTSELLDDTSFDVAATSTAAGVADATVVQLQFTAADVYTFKISDGVRTATVDPTAGVAGGAAGDLDEMLAAINYALDHAGMEDSITAAINADDDGIVLTQTAGRAINISAFRSDATGSMLVEKANAETVGVSRFLDDGDGEGAETVSSINIATSTGASAAMEIIDRAIEDVANERAKLGAVSNRLDYTISNLTNVSINTSAAQGRIQDADFAAESTQLAKSQILQQASMAMLAQANASKQGVLSLLQG